MIADPGLVLSSEDLELFKVMLLRRTLHEPAWYITNEAYFWKDAFYVDERVLIPRPETELLVETALAEIRQRRTTHRLQLTRQKARCESRASSHELRLSIIDVGTGAGAIAISLARELHKLETHKSRDSSKRNDQAPFAIYASDISPDAIEVAKLNAKRIEVERYITFLVGDALDPLHKKVDFIIGNPPYIPTATIGGLSYDIHHFEPRVALDGGSDGLDVHRKILEKAPALLNKGGSVFLEIGHNQKDGAYKIAIAHFPTARVAIIKDYNGSDRVLCIHS